jgi:coiled-coil domain-containing protein 130
MSSFSHWHAAFRSASQPGLGQDRGHNTDRTSMSSLAAARADNFYHGPDYDPKQHKSLNKYRGSHGALGDRARKLDQGILIIRFEMPFHVTCIKCEEMIAKGERFNAEKKCIGSYHSTKLWEFRMRHHCQSSIVIVTDPKNSLYQVVEGARQKVDVDAKDAGVLEINDEDRERVRNDAMLALETGDAHKKRARSEAEDLRAIQEMNDEMNADPYAANKTLRNLMRNAKREDRLLDEERDRLGLPSSIPLLPLSDSNQVEASIAHLEKQGPSMSSLASKSRREILSQSIFDGVQGSGRGEKGRGIGRGGGRMGSHTALLLAPPALATKVGGHPAKPINVKEALAAARILTKPKR